MARGSSGLGLSLSGANVLTRADFVLEESSAEKQARVRLELDAEIYRQGPFAIGFFISVDL